LTSNIAQVVLLLIGLAFQDDDGNSVFPLSPLEILWANLVTSSPLALGLGLEPAVADIMSRPPRSMRVGVFTKSLIIDKMVYGVTMGVLCLLAFVIVIYGNGSGALGEDCNSDYNETCHTVYEARATVFSVLTFTLLMTAWEVKDFNASLFNMKLSSASTDPANAHGLILAPETSDSSTDSSSQSSKNAASVISNLGKKYFSVFPTLYSNRFLFWACITGFVLVFPLVNIPEVNTTVFRHKMITWEWGVVFGLTAVYVAVIESWKAIKRARARRGKGADAVVEERKPRNAEV
jgi:P-type Na+/K+ transporter